MDGLRIREELSIREARMKITKNDPLRIAVLASQQPGARANKKRMRARTLSHWRKLSVNPLSV
jgi:hypothetical protein